MDRRLWEDELREIILSAFAGARYGAKIRFPHALVMNAMFGSKQGGLLQKVTKLTVQHAYNLARFAAIYKTLIFLLKFIHPWSHRYSVTGHPKHLWHACVGGMIGGYFCWGDYTTVNNQMLLYLSSRVLLATWKRLTHIRVPFPIVAALIWGAVMCLFEDDPDVLHPSLKASMDEIYRFSRIVAQWKRQGGNRTKQRFENTV